MDTNEILSGRKSVLNYGENFDAVTESGSVYSVSYLHPQSVRYQELKANPSYASMADEAVIVQGGMLDGKEVRKAYELGDDNPNRVSVIAFFRCNKKLEQGPDGQPRQTTRLTFAVPQIESNGPMRGQKFRTSHIVGIKDKTIQTQQVQPGNTVVSRETQEQVKIQQVEDRSEGKPLTADNPNSLLKRAELGDPNRDNREAGTIKALQDRIAMLEAENMGLKKENASLKDQVQRYSGFMSSLEGLIGNSDIAKDGISLDAERSLFE